MTDTPSPPPEPREKNSHQAMTTAVAIALLILAGAILFQYIAAKPAHELKAADPKAMAMMNPMAGGVGGAFSPIENGKDAPDFTLTTLDGKQITLSKFHEGKNALVVFYAPCGSG